MQSDLRKLPNIDVGLDGRQHIFNSQLKTIYHGTPKAEMLFHMKNRVTETIDKYFPHIFRGGKTVEKIAAREFRKIDNDPVLTDVAKGIRKERIIAKFGLSRYDLKVQSDADELLAILGAPDGTKLNTEQTAWMESNKLVGAQQAREYHLPGWDTSHRVWEKHYSEVIRKLYNLDNQMNNHYQMYKFYISNVGKMEDGLLKSHMDFYKMYAQGAMGFGVRVTDEMRNDPRLALKGTLYDRLADNNVAGVITKIGRKLGILAKPGEIPGNIQNGELADDLKKFTFTEADMMWLSNLEAQYQMASLLSHPKSYVNNIYGGTVNNLTNAGFRNLKDAKDIRYLKKINPKWNSMEDVQKEVEEWGVIEEFIRHQIGLTQGLTTGKLGEFVDDALKLISKDPMVADETLRSLAKKHELAESVLDKAAWFMRKSERILRRDSFMAHYVQEYKRWGSRLPYDHPWLNAGGLRGVKATQFLYTAPFKPMFSTTSAGKILTRFQLWAWNNVKLKREIIKDAHKYGFREGTPEFDRFRRMATLDILSIALANAFMYSIFDSSLPAPWNWVQDFSDWMFGDEKERDKAFFGVYPRAVAPLQMITPPALRMIAPTITAMVNNDFSEISNYHIWAAFPFGRIGRDIMGQGNIFQNPYRIIEKTTGIPYRQMAKYMVEKREEEPFVGF
jgi:hypothetical protein